MQVVHTYIHINCLSVLAICMESKQILGNKEQIIVIFSKILEQRKICFNIYVVWKYKQHVRCVG